MTKDYDQYENVDAEYGKAIHAWLMALPDDPYDLCPCGCGTKMRFVSRDDNALRKHELNFVMKYLTINKHGGAIE